MSLKTISESLPNGFHDCQILQFDFEMVLNRVSNRLDIWMHEAAVKSPAFLGFIDGPGDLKILSSYVRKDDVDYEVPTQDGRKVTVCAGQVSVIF
ncbi:hypothetical protein DOM22_10895 [Bdellovibrio sp. ZAP7]|uniref:hypothetical protein n=1 Tax=Bdellovibrio sp. ZAP7 TaxID=2231053 RepID=UPI001158E748|nr:hypothetical protein [Bdellovibrio sp. ZAP7]QDK45618.1 hypothetical protein DOM22_10895 [Bdellovibrio sp. ZAP7]